MFTVKIKQCVAALLVFAGLCLSYAQAATVEHMRLWLAPDHTRLVFDLTGPVEHKVFTLAKPDRIVLDIENSQFKANASAIDLSKSAIKQVRTGKQGKDLRLVLDLKQSMRPKSFSLKPNDKYGHRLVVDLYKKEDAEKTVKKAVPVTAHSSAARDIIVSIDAGHGGEDPGALGPNRLREKDVVLAIAKDLKKLFDRTPGYTAYLTRTNDYAVSLRDRTKRAREHAADLFVSIHADGFKDPRARGASVWVLSPRGASSEIGRWLAQKENSADLIGGVGSLSLEDKDDHLAKVLLDMSMTATRTDSRQVAVNIHKKISGFAKMHKPSVEQAGFVVLKSPDIPSILVETGFISNPGEAAKLRTRAYQQKMAKAVHQGIVDHFSRKPPMMTQLAQVQQQRQAGQHVVRSGDTLSVIALKYGVSLSDLRRLNGIKGDRIRVGQTLKIPNA
ncbi:MAG: N-acetylmuramoyl-L-alanine amidase [Pontibacterium sp.]